MPREKLIRLRYQSRCAVCGGALAPGSRARWERTTRTATCEGCIANTPSTDNDSMPVPVDVDVDRGAAGASATREWRRRHERRESEIRARHPKLGGLILALSSDPRSTTSWETGARGEAIIGASLNKLLGQGVGVLHDRRIPGSRANIDHIVISQAGVFVIDTKNYKGRVQKRDVGGLFTTDIRLYVGRRDQTKLVQGMQRQVEAVRRALRGDWQNVPITAALLFMGEDNWSLFDLQPLRFGDVYVLWGKALGKLIRSGSNVEVNVAEIERALAAALPPA